MAIPFLPAPLIIPTFNLLLLPNIKNTEKIKHEKLKKYIEKHWMRQITHQELSIHEINNAANNWCRELPF